MHDRLWRRLELVWAGAAVAVAWVGGCAQKQMAAAASPTALAPAVAAEPKPVAAAMRQKVVKDPTEARAQIQDLLRRMTVAVGTADQAGYLACVSLADPCFATEQRNWAKDLGRVAPESFDASLDGDEVTLDSDGTAAARLKMVWRMPEGRQRSIVFPAKFVRGESGWLYAGEKWRVLEGDHVRVLFESEDLGDTAQAVAAVLPEVRKHVHEGFELTGDKDLVERVQQVKLYTTVKHLQHSIYLSYTDGLAGWNEPGEAIKVLAQPHTSKGTLRVLLSHEYGHVSTFQLGPKANDMPWWVLEGIAELSSDEYGRGWGFVDGQVRRWAKRGGLVDWKDLADFHGEAAKHYAQVYGQGHHILGYISDRFGRTARNGWMRAMAQGATLEEATQKALGLSFEDLDKQWRESIAPKPEEKGSEEPGAATKPDGDGGKP